MKTYALSEIHEAFKAQGVDHHHHYATKCPVCGTVQSMASLVAAGADPSKVERYFAFSCEGRFNGAGEWPSSPKKQKTRTLRGCNWTLGGLFQLHKTEVEYPDGTKRPMFDLATPEEAQALVAAISARAA